MRDMFAEDSDRFQKFHIRFGDLVFDYSKNRINSDTMKLLYKLATEMNVEEMRRQMFDGRRINLTEDRAALHTALRSTKPELLINGANVMADIRGELDRMRQFSNKIRSGEWVGYTGKPIEDIVNIGIGGSDLGPKMVTRALDHYAKDDLYFFFVSNIDGTAISEVLETVDPETTLFLVASKTFITHETLTNAHTARDWFLHHAQNKDHIAKHFVALAANETEVTEFGIPLENMFRLWDFVGGRYSVWSSIGLPIMLAIGPDNFDKFLAGARDADEHFRSAKMSENIPFIMALLGIWYNNFFGAQTHAVLPYSEYLRYFPDYLQQLDMESNGKMIDRKNNNITEYTTGQVLWGALGTNGQHAFTQLIHQGTKLVPADFIGFKNSLNPTGNHHDIFMANFFAQTESLMKGSEVDLADNHRYMPGNRPTNTFLFDKLSPYSLGKLIALYEHKVFVQGIIWDINSFDQWGVQLGKQIANDLEEEIKHKRPSSRDSSTAGLIREYLN